MLVDPTPLDDDLLDPALADIAQASDSHDIDHWVRRHASRGEVIRERALARLAACGILESDGAATGFLLSRRVSRARRYHPTPDGTVQEEVRLRIMRVLFSEDIPDPRDTVIICLADAGGVFDYLLSREERAEVQNRIALVTKLDLIGQAVARAVREPGSEASAPAARPACEIPCAAGLPVAGNALDLLRNVEGFLLKQYRLLGPIFRVRAFGRRFIVLAGPEANRLLARGGVHFRTFETWQRFNADVGAMRQIMSMGGGDHARLRKQQAPAYSTGLLKSRMAEAVDLVRGEVAGWAENEPVAVQYMFQRILLEQLGHLTMGLSPQPYLDDLIVYLEALLRTNLHGNRPRLILRLPRVRRARRSVMELAGRILADHDPGRRTGRPPDHIDEVLALHRADPEFLPETDLPITVLAPFLAGLDTASSISACMLYELLRRPDLLARVSAEADALFCGGIPALDDLRRLDVTHRVALETMRVYPLGPAVPRVVANSFDFAGYGVGFFHRSPRLTFRSKSAFLLKVTSTVVPEDDVVRVLRRIGYRGKDDLMLGPHPSRSAFTMYVREGSDAGRLAAALDDALREHAPTYEVERVKGIVGPVEVVTVPASHPMWDFRTRGQAKSRYVLPTAPRDVEPATRPDGHGRT